ncbi:MAG: helix-turn-helix transcriptional regulator [Ruminococcaceae bacterium]|nr:helix-turn-helix transcriptional regulator [Oscillospiraceae bacterium]
MSKIVNAEKRVDEIKNYIKNNYGDCSLTMESIAHQIGLNPRYMLKLFKEQTDMLLKDYLLEIRISKATTLLKANMTIETVAKKCGYTSAHSFIRAFKRACGKTPGELRKANKED